MDLDLSELDTDDITDSPVFKSIHSFNAAELRQKDTPELDRQVAALTAFLDSMSNHSAQRERRNTTELEDLKIQIEDTKRSADLSHRQLLQTQEAEIAGIISGYQTELESLKHGTTTITDSCSNWRQLSSDLIGLKTDVEASATATATQRIANDQSQSELLRRNDADERRTQRNLRMENTESRIQNLGSAVLDLSISQRLAKQAHRHSVSECLQSQTLLGQVQNSIRSEIEKEGILRDRLYRAHLDSVHRLLEAEQRQFNNVAGAVQAGIDDVAAIRRATSKRCAQQLRSAQRDIAQIEGGVKGRQLTGSVGSAGTVGMFEANGQLRERVAQLQAEIERVKGQSAVAAAALKRPRTPKKSGLRVGGLSSPFSHSID
jgi:hypothetical protein